MTFMRPIDYTVEAVTGLTSTVDKLAACLIQGVARPWKTPALTAERRNELDAEAKAERLERVDIAPGESPAPLALEVMDELVEILAASEVLAERVCRAVMRPVDRYAQSAFADPRPSLRLIARLLPAADGSPFDPHIVRDVRTQVTRLQERADEALGLVVDGQVLDALCPWCDGRTELKPNGGVRTLRIRNLPGMDSTVVICEGGQCQPPEQDCGIWHRGNPAWRESEWDWLSSRIDHAAGQRAAAS